ncbi:hypothetical protein [Haloplanus sp.]|uniref:hypothetical protein n=1 Tax=Haloplanus sp. TaxID=1961696 RepID=UPI00262983B1|nr:hypothetical protein [Haloplanus sp.]
MSDHPSEPTPPDGLPDGLATELHGCTAEELRNVVVHAQELLQHRREPGSPIDPGPGEDVVRVTERDGYTEVVKRQPCAGGCPDCPHGPYLYHVREETLLDGGTNHHWTFLGEVQADG